MAFVVSEGSVRGLERLLPPLPYRVNVADGYNIAYGEIWRKHQSVRTVVSFLGRSIASIGLHAYERVSDTDRKRLTGVPLTDVLSTPWPGVTRYDLLDAFVQDLAIYDHAYLLKVNGADGKLRLLRLRPTAVEPIGESGLVLEGFRWHGSGRHVDIPADRVIYVHGYSPDGNTVGASPLESLRRVLAEEFEAGRMREQILRNGARVNGYLSRPKDAPSWSPEAKTKFGRQWKAQYTGGGPEAGGTPILEDGMTFVSAGQTARELQYIESRKLTREEVAAAYFIPPPMVGIMDGATFSNITEQHKMLYQDTLGPWLTMIAQAINQQLVPDLAAGGVYLEFNIQEKMQGSFEEQAASMSTAAGRPWMTANEIRALNNLPAIDGGDELVTPLNVLIGGQASSRDSGSQNRNAAPVTLAKGDGAVRVKAEPRDGDAKVAEEVLRRFFKRQRASVLSALGAKDASWWDADRWDAELAADLLALALKVSEEIGRDTMRELGVEPDLYSVERTLEFLKAVAESRAGAINSTTRDQIQAALDGDFADDAGKSTPAGVFDEAEGSRASLAGVTLATTLATFAVTETGRQLGRPGTTKTWLTTSARPRPSHAAMNGETVGIEDTYSNGMAWPGDIAGAGGDPAEIANCSCVSELTIY